MISSGKTPLLALCIALAAAVSWAFDGRTIDRNPDQCDVDIIDTVSWYSTESLRLTINPWRCGEPVAIPDGATALWIVQDEAGTNWIVRYATTVTTSNAVFTLEAGQGALPPGHDYTGFVDLMQGTTVLGVLDRFEVRVIPTSSDTNSIVPAAGTWESLYGAIASNTAAIAEMTANWPKTNAFTQAEMLNGYWSVLGPTWFDSEAVFQQAQITELGARWLTGLFSLDFWGTTNKLTADAETGALLYGGQPIGGGGSGSGFPLEDDADFAGYAAEDVGSIQLSGSTNLLTYGDGKLLYGGEPIETGPANLESGHAIVLTENTNTEAIVIAVSDNPTFNNMTIRGDLLISGDLSIYGSEHKNTTIRHVTNIYVGVCTNYITTDVYSTNHVYKYEYTYLVSQTTNYVDRVINIGGDVDNSRAASVKEPSFTIDNADTNAPVLTATGVWNLSGATLDCGTNLDSYATRAWTTTQVGTRLPSTANITVNGTNYSLSTNPTITIDPGGGGTIDNSWATIYDDAETGKTATGESAIQFRSTTNHSGIIWAQPITIGSNTVQVLEIGTGDSSSGAWTPTARIVSDPTSTVLPSDYLIWLDTSSTTNITLTLPDMTTPSQTIVVRRLGDTGTATLSRGTNTFSLLYTGDGCTVDWLAAKTNWYWRTF